MTEHETHETHVCAECGAEFTLTYADEAEVAVEVTVNDQNVVAVMRDRPIVRDPEPEAEA